MNEKMEKEIWIGRGVEQDRVGSLASSSITDVYVDLNMRVCARGQQHPHIHRGLGSSPTEVSTSTYTVI